MRLLVLGGTHHVGRAFVEAALARGDDVTTVTRGLTGTPSPAPSRATPTGSTRPRCARPSATTSGTPWSTPGRRRRSRCRRRPGCSADAPGTTRTSRPAPSTPGRSRPGTDEGAPVVDGDASSTRRRHDYAAAKRGGELAVLAEFGGDVAI